MDRLPDEGEAGVSGADLCRKHGVSDASVYEWKARYGGLDVSEAKRLKGPEVEEDQETIRGIVFPTNGMTADTSLSGARGARELATLFEMLARPVTVVSDKGTEFTPNAILTFADDRKIDWHSIAPGKPARDMPSSGASTVACATRC